MKNMIYGINNVLVSSVPIQASVKRYVLKKYSFLKDHNGHSFAVDFIERLRLSLTSYIGQHKYDYNHKVFWLKKYNIKPRKLLLKLYQIGESRPYEVIAFLKFPNTDNSVHQKEQDAYNDLYEELKDIKPFDFSQPDKIYKYFLDTIDYVQNLAHKKYFLGLSYKIPVSAPIQLYQRYAVDHENYYADKAAYFPVPPKYKSSKLIKDGRGGRAWYAPQWHHDLMYFKSKALDSSKVSKPIPTTGSIELVNKNGSTDYRAVANANKFTNFQQADLYMFLTYQIKSLKNDATFNQHRFDRNIQDWVDDPTLYPYGVDLHHATNYLPFHLGIDIINSMIGEQVANESDRSWKSGHEYVVIPKEVYRDKLFHVYDEFDRRILHLNIIPSLQREVKDFIFTARGKWNLPDGRTTQFTQGQPLGMMNSFRTLSLTNQFIAFMACRLAVESKHITESDYMLNDQYFILGDDIVFRHKVVAIIYKEIMKHFNVPISENKCFGNHLVEFAGETFISNQKHQRYTTDMRWLSWNNLFDYTTATGIRIPFDKLPLKLQRRWLYELAKSNPYLAPDFVQALKKTWKGSLVSFDYAQPIEGSIERYYSMCIKFSIKCYNWYTTMLSGGTNISKNTEKFIELYSKAYYSYQESKLPEQVRWTTDAFLVTNSTLSDAHTYNTPLSDVDWSGLVPDRVSKRQLVPEWVLDKYGYTPTDVVVDLVNSLFCSKGRTQI